MVNDRLFRTAIFIKEPISALSLAIPVYLLSITLFGRDVGEDKQSNFIMRVYRLRGRVNRNVIDRWLFDVARLLTTNRKLVLIELLVTTSVHYR